MFHIGWLLGRWLSVSLGDLKERMKKVPERLWTPLSCFHSTSSAIQREAKVALIILNRPIQDLFPLLKVVWTKAAVRAAADGGANCLMDCVPGEEWERYIPDVLTGDFDSIEPEVRNYCKEKGSSVIETPDQNATDFTKCLKIVVNRIKENDLRVDRIMVFGAFGGRIDQTMANINTLFLASSMTDLPVYLLGDESLACLLPPGYHRIMVNTGLEAKWCGLVPISNECQSVCTTGLKWNLENQPLQFGGMVSTSNTYAQDAQEVTVSTDRPLLWTMGIRPQAPEHEDAAGGSGSSEQSEPCSS